MVCAPNYCLKLLKVLVCCSRLVKETKEEITKILEAITSGYIIFLHCLF
jgi:hypothetical protein